MKIFCIIISFLIVSVTYSQTEESIFEGYEWTNNNTYSYIDGIKYNTEEYLLHPDFGTLPYDAPRKNVVEDLSRRTTNERYYIDLDNPSYFYIQKSSKPINYLKDGYLVALSPLFSDVDNGIYKTLNQPVINELNIPNSRTKISFDDYFIEMNNYNLKITHQDNSIEIVNLDWSNIDIGRRNVLVHDIYPGIDMRIQSSLNKLKSEFIIKYDLNIKSIELIDHLNYSSQLNFTTQIQDSLGNLYLESTLTNEVVFKIEPVKITDNANTKRGWKSTYSLNGNQLSYFADSSLLNADSIVYPIIIDPTFTAVGPVSTGFVGVTGSLEMPSTCSHSINVTFPGGSVPWDVSASWQTFADECFYDYYLYGYYYPCYSSEANISLSSSCGGNSPLPVTNSWQCIGCNNPGTWSPTLPFNSSGTQNLVQCYTPSCNDQTLTFNIELGRASGCPSYLGADVCNWATSWCLSLDQWQVTVQGRNLETLGDQVTGDGSTSLSPASCTNNITLNPSAQYGVPNYSYSWDIGGTTPTLSIDPFVYNGQTVSVDVTDACGVTRTASFVINCPLNIGLKSFSADRWDDHVKVNWLITNGNDVTQFIVERSIDGENFSKVGTLLPKENNKNYDFMDRNPIAGISYYRLKIIKGEESYYSDIASVLFEGNYAMKVIPNPVTNGFKLQFNGAEEKSTLISFSDIKGTIVHEMNIDMTKGINEVYVNKIFKKGIYIITINNGNQLLKTRFIQQ